MSAHGDGTFWLDEHPIVGYLLVAVASALVMGVTDFLFLDGSLLRSSTGAVVTFLTAFLALYGWSSLFKRAGDGR